MFLGICSDTEMNTVWNIVKTIILIIRILIPIALIVVGTIAFGKAIIADDDKEIKSSVTKLIKKVILAAFIFLLPAIVKVVLKTFVGEDKKVGGDSWITCVDKIL